MEKLDNLDNYDGFWRDTASKGSHEEKIKYLSELIRNQTEKLKKTDKADDKDFLKRIIKLAKEERTNIKK